MTSEIGYKYVSLFPEYRVIFDEGSKDNYNNERLCRNFIKGNLVNSEDHPLIYACANVLQYSTKLKEKSSTYNIPAGCKFLNYSLYYPLCREYESGYNVQTFYQKVKEQFHNFDVCDSYIVPITKEIFEKLQKLADLYDNFNKVKSTQEQESSSSCSYAKKCATSYKKYIEICRHDSTNEFCKELKNFRRIYVDRMKDILCYENTPKTLPSIIVYDTKVIISIPFVAIIVVSFFFFILNKFFSFGSLICPQIRKHNSLRDNHDEGTHQFQNIYESTNINSYAKELHISYKTV
ncbi:PIR protein [Plasmodium ovale]|uniref:PIR protein n=1 Tax=Plasmodium ovale TaxID=36330 RepID=A0A1D3JF09_PLAOA|nr:PIR protein [Plasmodium ovale]